VNGANGADDAAGHGAAQAEGIADGVDLLAHGELSGVGQSNRLEVGRVDLQQGKIVNPVSAHHLGRIAVLVAEHHLDAAVGALDDMVVGEHMAGLVEDEAGALALLRDGSVKEIEDQGGGSDVDHRGQHPFIDGDIVLLLGVVGGRGLSFGKLEQGAGATRPKEREMAPGRTARTGGEMRGEVPESAHQQDNQENAAQ
jgi:hypothetical protein